MSALNYIRTIRLQQTTPNVAKVLRISSVSSVTRRVYSHSDDSGKSKSDNVEKKSSRSSLRFKLDPLKRLESMLGEQNGESKRNGKSESMKDRSEVRNSPDNQKNIVTSTNNENNNAKISKRKLDPLQRLESVLGEHNITIDKNNVEFDGNRKVESMKEISEVEISSEDNNLTSTDNDLFTSSEHNPTLEKTGQGNLETSSEFSSNEHNSAENPSQGSSQPSIEDKANFFASRTARRSKLSPMQRYKWMLENADESLKERLESDVVESLKDLKKLADDLKNKQ